MNPKIILKKILTALTAFSLCAALCGCSAGNSNESEDDKLRIIATIFPAYDFARQVFGDTAKVNMLLKPGQESHSYDPSAKDIVNISNCDLFIYNGGESDEWVESVLKSAPDINVFRMTDAVSLLDEEISEGMQNTESNEEDGEEAEYDEHVWTSPKNAAAIIRALGVTAAESFPEIAENVLENSESYAKQAEELDSDFAELLNGEKRYFVFGDRFPLLYFFKEYELNYYAAFPGCGSETEPSAQTMTFLAEKLKSDDVIPAVFKIELSSGRLANVLSEDSGLETVEFHTCHNISRDDFNGGETYITLMRRNYDAFKKILGGK